MTDYSKDSWRFYLDLKDQKMMKERKIYLRTRKVENLQRYEIVPNEGRDVIYETHDAFV